MAEHRSIKEIQAELNLAIEIEAAEKREVAKNTKPDYTFTLVPSYRPYYKVYDSSCKLYDLRGLVNNKEELRKVGKTPFEGSMTYVFNTLSGKFVMGVSGGSVLTEDPDTWEELSEFIDANPKGGDITSIMNKHFGK